MTAETNNQPKPKVKEPQKPPPVAATVMPEFGSYVAGRSTAGAGAPGLPNQPHLSPAASVFAHVIWRQIAEDGVLSVPDERSTRSLRQAMVLQMQKRQGNGYVQRLLYNDRHNQSIKPAGIISSTVQRFGSAEHQQIGDEASGGVTLEIDLGDGTRLTYGEMVALAGDFYGSVDDIRNLATTPAGQAELRWTRWWALHAGSEPAVDEAVKTRVRDRYYQLAANNISHFSAGGTARTEYQNNHQQALGQAFLAGVTGEQAKWSEAMIAEAFSNHYLTDMFSAGHVRTPRQQIKEWYQQQYPNSLGQFISYTANWMTNNLDQRGDIPFWLPNSAVAADIATKIRELGGSAVESFSIGDIVSLAFHNQDNKGLGVISDVDPSGAEVSGGYRWTAKGDDHLAESPITRQMSVAAVRTSLNDLTLARVAGARAAGGTCLSDEQIESEMREAIANLQPFAAERYIPREDPDAGNAVMNWHWGELDSVLRSAVDREVKTAIADTLRGKASQVSPPDGIHEIVLPAEWLPGMGPYMAPGGVTMATLHVRAAFLAYCDHLATDGISALEAALGGGAAVPGGAGGMDAGVQ